MTVFIARNMRLATDVHEAAQAAGLRCEPPTSHRNGACVTLQRGFSFLDFYDTQIRGRREGDPSMERVHRLDLVSADPGVLFLRSFAWCLDILRTGRTCECGTGVNLRAIQQHVHFATGDTGLAYLRGLVMQPDDPWELNPDYQRDHVWTDQQRSRFLGFLLEGGHAPLIWVNNNSTTGRYEVIDGKQRLTACLRFLDGEISAEVSDGRQLWWRDFDEIDRRVSPTIKYAIVQLPTRAAVLDFYLKLNRGGTVHTDAEIDRVRALLAELQPVANPVTLPAPRQE